MISCHQCLAILVTTAATTTMANPIHNCIEHKRCSSSPKTVHKTPITETFFENGTVATTEHIAGWQRAWTGAILWTIKFTECKEMCKENNFFTFGGHAGFCECYDECDEGSMEEDTECPPVVSCPIDTTLKKTPTYTLPAEIIKEKCSSWEMKKDYCKDGYKDYTLRRQCTKFCTKNICTGTVTSAPLTTPVPFTTEGQENTGCKSHGSYCEKDLIEPMIHMPMHQNHWTDCNSMCLKHKGTTWVSHSSEQNICKCFKGACDKLKTGDTTYLTCPIDKEKGAILFAGSRPSEISEDHAPENRKESEVSRGVTMAPQVIVTLVMICLTSREAS